MRKLAPLVALAFVMTAAFNPDEALARAKKSKKKGLLESAAAAIEEKLVQPPRDMETCFSPDERCDVKLVKFIDSAQQSIDLAIYDINLDQLVHTLLVKAKSIPVRVVADRRQAAGSHSLVDTLVQGGVAVRFGRQRGIMHNKFTIIDGKMVETGSFNYTNHASRANNENQIYLSNLSVVERYRQRFEQIWVKGDPVTLTSRIPARNRSK